MTLQIGSSGHKFGVVAFMGPPNAGKSTLLNRILGQKVAIVSPKPQTTRTQVSGILTTDDAQVLILDTPGVHRRGGHMNRLMLKAAWRAMAGADCLVTVLDAAALASKPRLFDTEVGPLVEPVRDAGLPLVVALNKIDKLKDKRALLGLLAKVQELWPEAESVPVSALGGEGVDALMAAVLAHLPDGPPMYPEDQVSTVSLRFMAAEIVREKLFTTLRQELPYSTAVEIEQWQEEPGHGGRPFIRINAVIYTARNSHKAMIIGKGGQGLKAVGRVARQELEELLEAKVQLELWVKVRPGWPEDPGFLRALGLDEEPAEW